MRKTTFTWVGTGLMQYAAGTQLPAIIDGTTIYLPYAEVPVLGSDTPGDETADDDAALAPAAKKGKGAVASAKPAAPAPAEEAPKGRRGAAPAASKGFPTSEVLAVFAKLESGEIETEDAAVATIIEGIGDSAKPMKKKIRAIIDTFMADSKIEKADMVAEIEALFTGGAEAEEEAPKSRRGAAPAPASKKAAAAPKPKAVDAADLQVGDVVDVLLATDETPEGEWYTDAEVIKAKGGVPTIKFTDGDKLEYDETVMLEIKLHP